MRNLRSFLLEEIRITESSKEEEKSVGVPEGYKKIGSQGRITKELQELLQITSAKDLNLTKKNNSYMKVHTADGRKDIIKDLGLPSSGAYFDILEKLAKSEKLSGVFTGKTQKTKDQITIQMTSSYGKIAGRLASSQRFVKFWCQCACMACGHTAAPDELEFYVSKDGTGIILLIKKK